MKWFEATEPYIEKIVDPALLTFPEFYQLVNPSGKRHGENAYNWSVHDMNQQKEDFPTLLYRKDINGISFEFRLNQKDLYQDKTYAKTDSQDEYVRINGQIQYYTREELLALGKHTRFDYYFGIFHGNQCVGIAQDEWGCLLVSVASEYRGFGLGPILTKLAWEKEPGKDTGGCTWRGKQTAKKTHAAFVHEYLQKGFYSLLVREGKLTSKRVKEILASIYQDKERPKVDLNTENTDNWLLFHEDGLFIVYDKKFKDFYQEEENYWKDRCIKGIGDVGGMAHEEENYRLRRLGAVNDNLKKFLFSCCITWVGEENDKELYVYPEDFPLIDPQRMDFRKDRQNGWVKLHQPVDYKPLEKMERKWRKSFDKYDEFKIILMEKATSMWDH